MKAGIYAKFDIASYVIFRYAIKKGENQMKRIVGTIAGVMFVLTIFVVGICLASGMPGKGKYPIWNYEKTHREKGNYTVYEKTVFS